MRVVRPLLAPGLVLAVAGCVTTPASEPEYVAHFNEPFLTFASDGDHLMLTAPSELDGRPIAVTRNVREGGAVFIGMLDPDRPESRFRLTITRQYCEDDMAGLPFSHHAMLERGAALELRPQQGCARLKREPQPQE